MLSTAVTEIMTKGNVEEERVIIQGSEIETQGWETGTEAATTEEHWLLACFSVSLKTTFQEWHCPQ